MDEITQVLTDEQIDKICASFSTWMFPVETQKRDCERAIARAIERAVREATTQAQVDRNATLEEADAAIVALYKFVTYEAYSGVNGADAAMGALSSAVYAVRQLKTAPVSATQEQAMDAMTLAAVLQRLSDKAEEHQQCANNEVNMNLERIHIGMRDGFHVARSIVNEMARAAIQPSPEAIDAEKL